MKIKDMTVTACLAAAALVVFVIEAQLPPLGIPGVKLGLSNALVLMAMAVVGRKHAAMVLFVKIILGNIFAGTPASFLFSLFGGAAAYAVMALTFKFFGRNKMWVTSALGALANNAGQLVAALLIMRTSAVLVYIPLLVIAGLAAGIFTGLAAQFSVRAYDKLRR